MAIKKLDWGVSYCNRAGKVLRNEYETEAKAREFAARQRELATDRGHEAPKVFKLPKRRWEAGYQDNLGRWKTRRFDTKAEAENFLNLQKNALGSGTYVDPSRAEKTTVGMLYEQWIAQVRDHGANGRRPAKPKTVQDYEWIYRNHIAPTWQDYPLANIDYPAIGEWVQTLQCSDGRPASADARKRSADQFSRMMKFAVARRLLAFNPALDAAGNRDYVPAAPRERQPVYLTRAQLERLAACAGPYELLIRFTGLTGLRWGEATALLVQDLDLGEQPLVSVNKAYAEVKGKLVLGTTKGHETREVPLPPGLAEELRRYVHGKAPDMLLFPSAEGKPMRNSNFTRRYYQPAKALAGASVARLQRALGVSETRRGLAHLGPETVRALAAFRATCGRAELGPISAEDWTALASSEGTSSDEREQLLQSTRIRLQSGDLDFRVPKFHDLRHTAVSLYLTVTKNVKHVQRIAGHKDAKTTLNVYGALFDDDFYRVAEGLDALVG